MKLRSLRERVCAANLSLSRHGLINRAKGSVSAHDFRTDLVVIKPSGLAYEGMTPADMVVVTLDGWVVDGNHDPASDIASHLTVYRARPDVRSVVHTCSPYTTALSAASQPIPCCPAEIADEFSDPDPISGYAPTRGYAPISGEDVGREIVTKIGSSSAILIRQHGVYTVGASIGQAVKATVIAENIARALTIATQIDTVMSLLEAQTWDNYDRYHSRHDAVLASHGATR